MIFDVTRVYFSTRAKIINTGTRFLKVTMRNVLHCVYVYTFGTYFPKKYSKRRLTRELSPRAQRHNGIWPVVQRSAPCSQFR